MRDCRRATRELGAYSAGTLTAGRSAAVERHLACCAVCAERLRRLEETDALLMAARPGVPQLAPEVSREILSAALAARQPRPWLRFWMGGWAVAAACVLLATAYRAESPRPASSQQAAAPAPDFRASLRSPAAVTPPVPVRVAQEAGPVPARPRFRPRRLRRRPGAPQRWIAAREEAPATPRVSPDPQPTAPAGGGHLLVVFSNTPQLEVEVRDLPAAAPGEAVAASTMCDLYGGLTETEVRVSTERPEPEVILTAHR